VSADVVIRLERGAEDSHMDRIEKNELLRELSNPDSCPNCR